MKRPCIFFDRDGIINRLPPPEEYYVLSPERFFLQPPFLEALRVVTDKGYPSVVVTNQKCVHRGLITREQLDAIHRAMEDRIRKAGLEFLAVYVCPHDDGHPDRKPNPGLLQRAAADHDLDLARSWMIGDAERDIQAGQAAGCATTLRVDDGTDPTAADFRLGSIEELASFLEDHLPARTD